jgi:hypothetical protein
MSLQAKRRGLLFGLPAAQLKGAHGQGCWLRLPKFPLKTWAREPEAMGLSVPPRHAIATQQLAQPPAGQGWPGNRACLVLRREQGTHATGAVRADQLRQRSPLVQVKEGQGQRQQPKMEMMQRLTAQRERARLTGQPRGGKENHRPEARQEMGQKRLMEANSARERKGELHQECWWQLWRKRKKPQVGKQPLLWMNPGQSRPALEPRKHALGQRVQKVVDKSSAEAAPVKKNP